MDKHGRIIEQGALYVENETIVDVGRVEDLKNAHKADLIIEAPNSVIMPGLVNCHIHFASSLIRGLIDDTTLEEWGDKFSPPSEYGSREWNVMATRLVCLEMIKAGVTSYADGGGRDEVETGERYRSGLRGFLTFLVMDEIGDYRSILRLIQNNYSSRLQLMLGPWWVPEIPREVLEEVGEISRKHGMKVRMHVAETRHEIEEMKRKHGCDGSVEYLEKLGLLGPNLIAAHCVHVSPNEIELLQKNSVKVAHCPISNAKLGDGTAPLLDFIRAGITVGLGTDGVATNNCVDIFGEMKFACLLQRAIHQDPHAIGAETVLKMATIDAAKVLGAEHQIGSLEVGKRADVTILDFKKPHFYPKSDVISHIVYSAQPSDVNTVIVDGRIIMQDRRVLTIEESKTLEEIQHFYSDAITSRVVSKTFKEYAKQKFSRENRGEDD